MIAGTGTGYFEKKGHSPMIDTLSPSAEKVQNSLREAGYNYQVIELPQTTRSAQEAAQAVGCQVGQIVKSLIFRTKESNRPILIAASGINRVSEAQSLPF